MPLESKWANIPDNIEFKNRNIKSPRGHYKKPHENSKKDCPKKTIHNNSTTNNEKQDNSLHSNKSNNSNTKQPTKLELLKQKIEEQKNILKAKHKEQQQKLLEEFLNDDSPIFNWEDSINDDEKILERINKL